MNRRRILGVSALVALVLAVIATRGFGILFPSVSGGLTLHGNVDIRQVDLAFRVSGRIASLPFEEGTRVRQGSVVAELDPGPLKDKLRAANAQIAITNAELNKRINGNRPQDIAQAQARLADLQASLEAAKGDFDRREALVKKGAVSEAVLETTAARFRSAQAQVRAAEQALALERAGARKEDIEVARAQHQRAIAEAGSANSELSDTILRAPNTGTILTRVREQGAIVQAGETVMTLTIENPLRVRAYIAEPDVSRISPGMAVTVRTDGNDRIYHGRIGHISPTAEFTPKTVQTEALRTDLVYRVRIIVTNPDDALRQGAPVTVAVPGARPHAGN
ncbi:HlyD family efflux transporter periplasmic adaptor subunit [Sphingobium sp. BS19]|uniref:HlyD family efflux transporter periplasmic adaptor subunit n=1 Tax=Sphingobium sp. BS19 TaxID=3018973 RepID=UPI0022EF7672|nr:HlyD family efflux transporter periplasmic adaptor subunit [Sphingobium sp. BS19]GLJ00536.1 UPF0194 membrane protein RB0873 [Sphingobium sp. BS19]